MEENHFLFNAALGSAQQQENLLVADYHVPPTKREHLTRAGQAGATEQTLYSDSRLAHCDCQREHGR